MIGPFRALQPYVARGLCAALLLASTTSSAQGQADALSLTYVAVGTSCPSQERFEAAVRARTPLARFGPNVGSGKAFRVDAREARGRFTAKLDVATQGGAVADRLVEGDTCEEVIDALALVAALAIDPRASTAPLPAQLTPDAAPPPSPAVPREPVGEAVALRPARPRPPWVAGVGAGTYGIAGVTPSPLLGLAVHGAIEQSATGIWAPAARLMLGAAMTFEGAGADATFALTAAGLDVCPSAIHVSTVALRPCVGAGAGILHARGITVSTPGSADRFWFDLRGVGRARWTPGGGRWFVELEAGVLVPVTRPTFVFRTPRIVVHEVAPAAPFAGIALGLRFP